MKIGMKLVAGALLLAGLAAADEGMWLMNKPPARQLKRKYGFEATPAWLEHLQRSAVRFNNGGSGSFVSADGLVLTNQHVGADCVQKLGTREKDYIHLGFTAPSRAEEPRCADLELNVLNSIEDVTARVNSAVSAGMDATAAQKARRAAVNSIEKESLDRTGLRSDVVMLYNGGQYHLYRYKKYTDVRLVFTPELDITFFGGDPDNFEYPRYNLDITFFRVYENGVPAKIDHYLKWSRDGARDGDLVFIAGNPGRTDRQNTVAHLEFLRDFLEPRGLNGLRRLEVLLSVYSSRSIENARRAQEDLRMAQNSRKARLGALAGLQDPAVMDRKRAEEKALREAVEKSPELSRQYGDAWDQVAAAVASYRQIQPQYQLLELGTAFRSDLFSKARTLVRMAEETKKPNAERLREYSEAALESLKQDLFSEAPIYKDLETVKLADSLALLMETMGADDETVKKLLAGKSPRGRAAELVNGTRLDDVSVRKALASG
ncbi:MAG: S46 family peptidase, partial [Bryobacteraceae bacterium]